MSQNAGLLVDQAVARLRALATGNGLAPETITVLQTDAQDYTIKGETRLTPVCEATSRMIAGRSIPKKARVVENRGALQAEAQKIKQDFMGGDWFGAASEELKTAAGEGWGLDGATITLPAQSVTLAATEACTACQGQGQFMCTTCAGRGHVTCSVCLGRGQEYCYHCSGRGTDPSHQGQPCSICQGQRTIFCRTCRSITGQMACPACQGRRGSTCPTCQGAGAMTEEMTFTASATAHFTFKGDGLPSGLRRGLGRLGVVHLAKGYADITRVAPPVKEDAATKDSPKTVDPVIYFQAVMPYADVTVRLGATARAVVVGVFGKRGVLLDVPPFLDEPLKPWREKLGAATQDGTLLDAAQEAPAVAEAVRLVTQGKNNLKEFRRRYPYGLSTDVMTALLNDAYRALGRLTFRARLIAAVGYGVVCTGLEAVWFRAAVTFHLRPLVGGGVNLAVVLIGLGLGVVVLNVMERAVLKKRFPAMTLPFRLKIGKTGAVFLAVLAAVLGGVWWLGGSGGS